MIIKTCCVLHNICEIVGDTCDADWITTESDMNNRVYIIEENNYATEIRNALATYFSQN